VRPGIGNRYPLTALLPSPTAKPDPWLVRFHAGDRRLLAECYREHFATVERAIGSVVTGADKETVIHDLFCRLLHSQRAREGFQGGSLAAWLSTLARNQAIDYWRRHRREHPTPPDRIAFLAGGTDAPVAGPLDAQRLIDRFRRERLPPRWRAVFEARFVGGLSQRETARRLGMRRTTLAYQEMRIRSLLERFVLAEDP
jgi:RNA polymerase sigma-70 factor, ECF subfamily